MTAPHEEQPLRIGLRVHQYGAWDTLVTFAQHAESLGFESLWVNDHFRTPGRLRDTPAFDAFTTLAGLASLTHRPRLGVAVASASYRPAALAAKMATAIDNISGGRLTLGLGTGSDQAEHEAYGVRFGDGPERAEQLESAFRTIRAMLDSPAAASVPGSLNAAQNLPAPVQTHLPIWIAANKRRLLGFAGKYADGLFVAFTDPAGVAHRLDRARENRADGPFHCALYTYVVPVESTAEVERWLQPEADALGTTPAKLLRWLDSTGLVGAPSDLRDRLAQFEAVGVTDLVCVLPNRTPLEAIDGLAEALLTTEPGERHLSTTRSSRLNLADLLVESHRRQGRGADPAVIERDSLWSFDDLSRAGADAASILAARGVHRGDRVAIAVRDGMDWVRCFLGAMWLGAVAVPLDPHSPAQTLLTIIDDCEPRVVLVDEATTALPGAATLHVSELRRVGPNRAPAAVDTQDLAYLIYSSGSTGRPKAAMHSHGDPAVSVATYATEILELGPGDRCHSVARMFTSMGFGNGFFRPLGKGAAAVLAPERPNPRSVLDRIDQQGVTVLAGVPTFWSQLVRFLERHPHDAGFGQLRLLVSSGDALPEKVSRDVVEAVRVPLVNGLGCSECSNTVISWRAGEPLHGTLGRAIDGVEIKLADADGQPVTPGEPGQLWIMSDSNTTGYWRRRELTREVLYGPWLCMGDMLREVQPGVYRHVGRSDALFKVDGKWVSPPEVEAALLTHPLVFEAAVIGRADDSGLVHTAAVVVLGSPAPDGIDEILRRHVTKLLPRHMAPQEVSVVDALPRLPSGKIARRQL